MISIIACEDIPTEAAHLKEILEAVARERGLEISVRFYTRGEQLLLDFSRGEADLAFIDVVMGDGMSGVDTARVLRERDDAIPIVFVTSSAEYALDGYSVQATHYLLKPATFADVANVFDRCGRQFAQTHRTLELVSRRSTERVLAKDVIYAEVLGNRTTVKLREEDLTAYQPLSKIVELGGDSFLRCHRSFLVNMDHVAKVKGHEFVMDNGDLVPIRTNGSREVIDRYQDYLAEGLRSR